MIVYKGMREDMTCTQGRGKFQYHLGETIREDRAKTAAAGLHCTENPFLVLDWYPLDGTNRYFLCEAAGSIDEDQSDNKIACTELTIVKELSVKELAGHGMMFMVQHPQRDWLKAGIRISVAEDRAEANCAGAIAIARGEHPMVKGAAGAYLGMIKETGGLIEEARLVEVKGEIRPDTWYTLHENRPKEVER